MAKYEEKLKLKKVLKSKHRYKKMVNNLGVKTHIYYQLKHTLSKDIIKAYKEMSEVYAELDADFQKIDVVDLEFYERWLNERY